MLRAVVMREPGLTFRFVGWLGLLVLASATKVGRARAEGAAPRSPDSAVEPETPTTFQRENSIDPEMARHMAGTWGDPSKVVGNLPGVAHAEPARDGISVWGARPSETRVLVDGVEVPALLHLGGLRSAVGTNLTGPLDLVPGAYGADSGRALGGLVLVGTRELPAQGVHGAAEANLLDSSLMLAAAPSTRFRFGVAGTWSYLDRYHARLDEATTTFYQVPRYRDFQAKVELDVARQRRLTLLVLGAAEQVRPSDELTGAGPTDPLAGNDWLLQRNRTWSRIAIQYADERRSRTVLMPFVGWTDDSVQLAPWPVVPAHQYQHSFQYGGRALRDVWRAERALLTLSFDALVTHTRASQQGDLNFPPRDEDNRYFGQPFSDNALASSNWVATVGDVAAGLSVRWQIGHVTLVPALRADVFPLLVERDPKVTTVGDVSHVAFAIGPRVSMAYDPLPRFGVETAAGLYSQPPNAADLSQVFGNPSIGPSHAGHASLGPHWRLGSFTTAEATGFFRQSWDLPARNVLPSPPIGQALRQDGRARAYGGQLMLRAQVAAKLDAWLAYTLSRSEMRFQAGGDSWRLAPQDRTRVLTGVFAYRFWGWVTSARFRYASGAPYTPVVGAYLDSSLATYEPILGMQNSARLPAFLQADVRIERELHLGGTLASLFFEIVNVGFHDSPEAIFYSLDFSQSAYLAGAKQTYFLGGRWQL